ncbi:carbohydrate ABC transporter permease [Halobacillus sp. A5]|uniref:carbohydrate ABC transporter permease n=1 Tax=Halobacillus sp. A5 TaxID=2880263 RepID=UPI0020A6A49C|nr:sugar ABC transporter permease [Halobacillus sp. A5]MCP3028468.1 sugar ABC transporter permease [Halobacillus sp. A5]
MEYSDKYAKREKRKSFSLETIRFHIQPFYFLLPAMVLLGIFLFLPALLTIYYAFTDYYLLTPDQREFVGFSNFTQLFSDPVFMKSLQNISIFVVCIIIVQVGAALGLALLINNNKKSNIFLKVAFFSPVVMSLVVISVLWLYLLNPSDGLINSMLQGIGIDAQPFLTSPNQAIFAIVFVSAWQGAGYQMLIFLAGLQNISREVYEAAKIDGATKWKSFLHITLPLLRPTTTLIVFTTLIAAFKLIIQPMIMTQGGPLNSTMTPIYYIYQTGFTDRLVGYSSAMTVVFGVLIAVVTFVQRKLAKEEI